MNEKKEQEIRERLFMLESLVSDHTTQLNRERGKPFYVMELGERISRLEEKVKEMEEKVEKNRSVV